MSSAASPVAAAVETPAEPAVLRSDADGVALVTLNRPARRNSLSEAMMTALSETLTDISVDPAVRAVVLSANGPVFSAGHDLKELQAHRGDEDRGRHYYDMVMRRCAALMTAIVRLPQPVIAAVDGMATAAGCQLVASCDLAVAGAKARFCTPGVNIGLFCHTPMVALSRTVSRKHALEMLLLGEWVEAEDAHRMGLVNRVVADGEAVPAARDLALRIAAKSQVPVKLGKAAFYAQSEMTLDNAYAFASQVMTTNMLARDAEEGISAVLDKRAPQWEDR
ncbi:MAG: enoyl-CoA hydratase [Rhizobiales bacterium 24-66-13]|jgi:enoyl-CoA hydratase/carnithine racemase|nr:MAG: enoyl-CoA hydratase [Rhizobiales bacterium 35-66-30]OYZ71371.1 MAG: enoyl-CoA hydratase [Rhizobiales bacterium 24-66-13]OZA99716.1 MAG: enoyl-CoA hydratase [Rhizobiales bacterium 39-66-18]HQS09190.1 enoyl-CoA hydratase [Xanthobacteraceae bacterium]HQS47954.1 enoyl-CoA hydratase [Xanthobacteraceae bacterium]